MVYECYKEIDGKVRWFNVRELYRWGQGFRELDEPVYAEDTTLYVRPELGWGCELDDGIAIDFEFDESFTDEEKEQIENLWCNGDPDDEMGTIPMHGVVPKMSRTPGAIRAPAPKLGEHNREILGGLGLSDVEIQSLAEGDVIYAGPQRKK